MDTLFADRIHDVPRSFIREILKVALDPSVISGNSKLMYTVPNFQNPSGISYPGQNRKEIAAILDGTKTLLIEDDPYGDLRFSGSPEPSFYNLLPDQTILLGTIPKPLRLVCYQDQETGKEYRFLTNADHLDAKTIADLYKERWQIELFFKWIKQNLKIKTFLGTSLNAVLTQVWIALIVYLLLSFLKFKAKLGLSMQQILRLLQLNLFERRNFIELFKPPDTQPIVSPQILLWAKL